MFERRTRVLVAAAMATSIVAAACGGDDATDSTAAAVTGDTTASTATTAKSTSDATTAPSGSSAGGEVPASMEEWEALWEEERAAIVTKIEDNGWGVSADGKTLTGPEGFTIDLSKCGGGNWSSTEGLTDTEIKFGHTISLSGVTADYGNATKTAKLMFDHYGEEGFFTDSTGKTRTINYIVKDDGYDPARTIPLTEELLDAEKVFADWALGTPPILRIYDKLNERCVPNVFMQSGHPAFGDPVNHPWTVGAPQTSYSTEAVLWGAFLDQRIDEFGGDKVKVAALVMNNDFGRIYDAAFRAYLEQSPNRDRIEYVTQTVEPQAPSINDPMTSLAAEDPNIFIAMVAAQQCTQAVVTAAENGMHESVEYLFQPAVCTGAAYVNKEKVGGDGMAADGWWLVNPAFKDFNDPAQFGDPFVAWARDLMLSNGIDPKASSSFGTGILYSWPLIQVFRIAGDLEGGLNRSNMILATRALEMTHPGYLPGVKLHLNGNVDGFVQEAGAFQQWDGANQVWVIKGEVIDLDGKSKPCAWDASAGVCR
jgi:branched-chain amino acid transport system substrate-binding protein